LEREVELAGAVRVGRRAGRVEGAYQVEVVRDGVAEDGGVGAGDRPARVAAIARRAVADIGRVVAEGEVGLCICYSPGGGSDDNTC
jgi:hypothetical protein